MKGSSLHSGRQAAKNERQRSTSKREGRERGSEERERERLGVEGTKSVRAGAASVDRGRRKLYIARRLRHRKVESTDNFLTCDHRLPAMTTEGERGREQWRRRERQRVSHSLSVQIQRYIGRPKG